MKGKTIGIIAIKGGVGKTTTVTNLGTILAQEFGKKVLVVDANFSSPTLGLHLGIVDPHPTLTEVMMDRANVKEAIMEHEHGFDVLPCALLPKKLNPFKLRNKLANLKQDYDVILIDSSPTLNAEILSAMIASDELFVVTSPDYPTLSCTMHAVKVAKREKATINGIIVNRVRNKKFELSVEDIQGATGVPVVGVLRDDVKMLEALAHTLPGAVHAPKREFAYEYRKIAAALLGETYEDPRLLQRLKGMFWKEPSLPEINRHLLSTAKKGDGHEDKA